MGSQSVPSDVWYSWFPGTGRVIDLTRPQVGSYDCRNALQPPHPYWLSPSARTEANPWPTSKLEVDFCRQLVASPRPPLKNDELGSHAISPPAAITGSAPTM